MDKIRILGVDYDVVEIDNPELHGLMCDKIHTIGVDKNTKQKIGTLIHEVIEAIDTRLELKLKHRQISSLDAALTQVLMDNAEFCKLISRAAKK